MSVLSVVFESREYAMSAQTVTRKRTHYECTNYSSHEERIKLWFGVLHHQGFSVSCTIMAVVSYTIKALVSCTIRALVSCTIKAVVPYTSSVSCNSVPRLSGRFPFSVTAHVFVCIKLLSTGACANIIIREIMLINIISCASWTLYMSAQSRKLSYDSTKCSSQEQGLKQRVLGM